MRRENRLLVFVAFACIYDTYVNPLVALALGWAIAGEVLAARVVFGGLVVIAAIAWMSRVTSGEAPAARVHEQHRDASTAKERAA